LPEPGDSQAGLYLIEYFRGQLAHKHDLISRLQELRGLRTGNVNVILGEGLVSDVLAGPIQHFCRQYPGIKFKLDLGSTNDVIRRISEDEGDLVVLPVFAVTTEVEAGALLAIEIDHPILMKAEAHLVTRAGRRLSVASNKMLQLMSSQMRAFR
jgi:DNA-binding transcriptional LysR family regulator